MDAAAWLGLEPTPDPFRFRLPVTGAISSGIPALFGGCGIAAGIAAMETATGRPCVWATAQFLDYARPPAVAEIAVTEVVRGHRMSQVRVSVCVEGTEIITVLGTLGRRELPEGGEWAVRPDVPGPDDVPLRRLRLDQRGTVAERIDNRLARARDLKDLDGTRGDGRAALWCRVADLDPGVAVLAILGDYVPFGISQSLGLHMGGNSLDNTLRVVDADAAGGWILADVRIHAIAHGFGHGLVHLWSEDGRLLATASQSAIVRSWDRRAEAASANPVVGRAEVGDRGPDPAGAQPARGHGGAGGAQHDQG